METKMALNYQGKSQKRSAVEKWVFLVGRKSITAIGVVFLEDFCRNNPLICCLLLQMLSDCTEKLCIWLRTSFKSLHYFSWFTKPKQQNINVKIPKLSLNISAVKSTCSVIPYLKVRKSCSCYLPDFPDRSSWKNLQRKLCFPDLSMLSW